MKSWIALSVLLSALVAWAPARADIVEFLARWGSAGAGDGQMSDPQGICVDPAGNVFVADTQNRRIEKFSPDGVFLRKWVAAPPAPTELAVVDVVSDPAGNIYACSGDYIIRLDNDLLYLGSWWAGGGLIYKLAMDPTGQYIYASLYEGVGQWTVSGLYVRHWAVPGDLYARGIACAADGSVYVVAGGEVRKYSATGTLLGSWNGSGEGEVIHPGGLAVGPNGWVFVCANNANDYTPRV